MADISKINLPNDNTTYDIVSKTGRGLIRCETGSTSTATAFVVDAPGVTELYEGLTLAIKNTVIASASGCTINVNGLGAKSIWLSLSNALLTTQWALNTEYLFVYDATNDRWVIQQGYNTNDDVKAYTVYRQYTGYKSGEISVFAYTLIMQRPNGTWESIVTSSSTALDKVPNPHGFLLYDILYWSDTTVAPNSTMGINDLVDQVTSRVDMRYSFNIANSAAQGFQTYTPVYIVGTLGNDGLFYLDNPWWTQTLPSTEDGKLYIYIGSAYDRYRMPFLGKHPIYRYVNGMIRQYIPDAGTVNGHTVATDVPANAEFTDTQSDWNASSGKAQILNKPTIPTVNNGTLTIQKNGTQVATFTANQSGNSTANITVPTVTDTYSSTGTDATSGKAVAAALGTLDGTISGTPSSAKTLTAFSQTNGKVSATFGDISITKSQVSDFPTLGTAAAKNYTTSVTSGSNDLVTSGAVYTAIDNLPEPMVFKGSLGTGGTITSLPVNGTASIGDTYKVITAGTYAGQAADVGDTFICLTKTSSANTWELIPSGDEPSGTVTSVTIKATSPIAIDSSSAITTSGTRTLSHANSGVTAGTYKSVTVNATGHITAGTNPTTLAGYGITDALPSSTTYAGSSSVGGAATSANKINTDAGSNLTPVYFSNGVPVDSLGKSIPFIVGTGTTTGTWLGELPGLTAYYDGLLILYKIPIAGKSTTTLNLNNLGAKTCYLNSSTKLTTHYAVNQPILLAYSANQNSGCWMCIDNYDGNSNTIPSAYSTTATDVAAKTASCTNFTLKSNSYLHILFQYANTAESAVTLNVNSSGAKSVYINGTASSATNYSIPAGTYIIFYDGTNYYLRTDGKLTASITGDAATVGGHTVAKNVPSDAVFTDTKSDWNATSGNAQILNKPTLGTAAAKDIPTSGDASTTQVVMGNDSRLTNARTPTSHTHGNIQNDGTLQTSDVTIANGDKLVITDSSNSNKVARTSITFDGSTATKCLTQKGTWEDFGNGAVTGVKGKTESTYSTGNVNITPAKVGAVDLEGDTMSGNLRIERTDPTNNAIIYLGNTSSTGINQYILYNNGYSAAIRPETSSILTDDRKLYIPDKSGTIATIDDITPYYVLSTLDSSTNVANSTQVDKPPNVQVTSAGVYLVIAHVQFAQNANGIRELRITQSRSNSVIGISTGTTGPASNVTNSSISESYIFLANKNDTFGLRLYQSSGGTLAATWRELQVYRLSPMFMS